MTHATSRNNTGAVSKHLVAAVGLLVLAVVLGGLAVSSLGGADEGEVRARLTELGVLATLDGSGGTIASVNFATMKDQTRFREALELVLGLRAVSSLNLDGMPIEPADLDAVGRMSSLASLSLNRCGVGGDGLAGLGNLRGLAVLNLNGTRVADADLPAIGRLTNLTAIDLSDCGPLNDLTPLAGLPKLSLLVLARSELGENALAGVAAAPALTRVSLGGAGYSADDLQVLQDAKPALVVDE